MNKNYWKNFYQRHAKSAEPSLFARFVRENYLLKKHAPNKFTKTLISHFTKNASTSQNRVNLLELGCGNGRDSLYFAKNGIKVVAIDQVQEVITYLQNKHSLHGANPHFIVNDFTRLNEINSLKSHKFDCIYSRFTLHSISANEQENLLSQLVPFLKPQGIFAVEARGYKNALYEKGEAVKDEKDAFIYDEHYRRFINVWRLCEALSAHFDIAYASEYKGFAPFGEDDDYFFRVIATLQNSPQSAAATQRERERERESKSARYFIYIETFFIYSQNKFSAKQLIFSR